MQQGKLARKENECQCLQTHNIIVKTSAGLSTFLWSIITFGGPVSDWGNDTDDPMAAVVDDVSLGGKGNVVDGCIA